MNIVWRFFTVASLPVFFYCAGPAVNGFPAGCLLWFVVDKGCIGCLLGPGPPGFSSLCLSYRFCPVKPLALFLKKKRTARPRPGHGGVGRAGIPSVASLFGGCTGPLRRPKKRSSLAATPPATTRPLAPIARRAGLLQRATPTSAAALSKPGPPGDLVPTPLQNHQPLVRAGISPCQPAGLSIERWWCHHSPSRNPFRSPDPPDPCSTPHLDRPEGRAPKIPPDLGSGAVGARPPGRSGFAADPKPPNRPSCTGHSPSNQTASQWG